MIASITWFLFSSRLRIFLTVVTFLIGLYALAGFVIVPWLARPRIVETIAGLSGREVRLDVLKLNPFTFSGTIEGFEITDPDGERLLSLDRAHANLQLSSFLFRGVYHLKVMDLAQPYFRFLVNADGSLNIADLIDQVTALAGAEPKEPVEPKTVRIDTLRVSAGSISVTDLSRSTPFVSLIAPISFDITGFHTSGDDNSPYTFAATSESGETVSWEGFVALNPLRSKGRFEAKGFFMPKYEPFYDIILATDVVDGVIAVSGAYEYNSGEDGVMRLEDGAVTVESISVIRGDDQSPVLSLASGSIAGATVDVLARTLEVESVSLRDGALHLKRLADGRIDLLTLIDDSLFPPEEASDDSPIQTAPVDPSPAPAYHLKSVRLEGFTIEVTDEAAPSPAFFALDEAGFEAGDIRSETGAPLTLRITADVRSGGRLGATGSVTFQPVTGELDLEAAGLALMPANPYLASFADIQIADGAVSASGRATFDLSKEKPTGRFEGRFSLADLKVQETANGQTLAELTRMEFEGIEAGLEPTALTIGAITLVDPRATVTINEGGSVNLLQAARVASEEPEAETTPVDPEEVQTGMALSFPVTIGSITLENAGALLTDRSVSPAVTIGMESLSGIVAGLSSEELARADLDLAGTLTGGTRLSVTGQINPLIEDRYSDLEVVFNDFNLTAVSPYFGKYAGYLLQKGKLSFDLTYKISQSELIGENTIVIDQMTLGSKVESEDALNLPIPLAISLMKDRDGVITLDVPVSGNLKDPSFGFGRVISQAIVNVLTKLVTSPFSMLGGLVPGGADTDLSYAAFAAGSTELDEEAARKLEILATALTERPTLKVEIIGGAGGPTETSLLKTAQLDDNLRVIRWRELKDAGNKNATLDQVVLAPGDRDRLIVHSFNLMFPDEAVTAEPTVPASRTASKPRPAPGSGSATPSDQAASETGESDGSGLFGFIGRIFSGGSAETDSRTTVSERDPGPAPESGPGDAAVVAEVPPETGLSIEQMEFRLIETLTVPEEELRRLAAARAEVVRANLESTGGIAASRLFVVDPEDPATISAQSGDPRVTFELE